MSNNIIEVHNLYKKYRHAKSPSVQGISFSVPQGAFFSFLGPNGAGKTTTISILTTMLNKTSGQVSVAGFDATEQPELVRQNIGIIFQKPTLDGRLTAEQNIRLHAAMHGIYPYRPSYNTMPRAYRHQVEELAQVVGLKDALFKPAAALSGGMARKLEIMRSLITRPKILFLDEPSTGLDAVSRRDIWQYIDSIRKQTGMTVFLTTHYLEEAQASDQVAIMNHGQIVAVGSPEALETKLAQPRLILDADDQPALLRALAQMKVDCQVAKHVTIPLTATQDAQPIIQHLAMPLNTLQIKEASLEDAYVALLGDTKEGQ